jgi:ABC-2 type transport system permease protein
VTLAATWRLVRFIVARDRLRLTVWVVALVAIMVVSAASLLAVYVDQASISAYTVFHDNPALVVFAGPMFGIDDPSIGVILVNEIQLWGAIAAALMSMFLVTRSTRADEDDERTDLVRSLVVGRHAPTAAALLVVGAANVAVGVASAVGFVALGYDLVGSLALAASVVAVGVLFAAITAVAAQLTGSARACLGLSALTLVVAFVVRAVGDVADSSLSMLSPIGLAQGVRAFAGEQWWTLGVAAVVTGVLVAVAFDLSTRRDLGSGLLGVRPGPAGSGQLANRPMLLPLRLQRGALAGWLAGLFITGVVYGSIAESVDQMIADNPIMADLLATAGGGTGNLTDAYLATALSMLAMIAGGLAISSTLVASAEERSGRAETVLCGPVARVRWYAAHLAVSVAMTVVAVAVAGFGVGLAYAVTIGDPSQMGRLAVVSLAMVPAVWVLAGLAAAIYGLAPRVALAGWVPLAVVVVIGFFGELLRLPQWVRTVSPFAHVPAVPAEPVGGAGPLVLAVVAVALMGVGLWGLARRDLTTA